MSGLLYIVQTRGDAIAANQDNAMYHWKSYDDRWKGEGIYHLTFALRERRPILGTLTGDAETAEVILSSYGSMLLGDIRAIEGRHEGVQVYCSMIIYDLDMSLPVEVRFGKFITDRWYIMGELTYHASLAHETATIEPAIRVGYNFGRKVKVRK